MRAHGHADLAVAGLGEVQVDEADLVITETPREGWAVAAESGASIALDLELTDELRRAGLAREVIRAIQEARKQAGFEVSDRICLWWSPRSEHAAQAMSEYRDRIADEVLATQMIDLGEEADDPQAPAIEVDLLELGLRAWIARREPDA